MELDRPIWGARKPGSNITYLCAEYCAHQEAPAVHAAVIRSKDTWIPGTIDPAAGASNQKAHVPHSVCN